MNNLGFFTTLVYITVILGSVFYPILALGSWVLLVMDIVIDRQIRKTTPEEHPTATFLISKFRDVGITVVRVGFLVLLTPVLAVACIHLFSGVVVPFIGGLGLLLYLGRSLTFLMQTQEEVEDYLRRSITLSTKQTKSE